MKKFIFILLTFFLSFSSLLVKAKTVRDDVREVNLKVSMQETKISFPDSIKIGLRDSYKKDWHIEVIDNIVYVKAKSRLNPNKRYRFVAKSKSNAQKKSTILVISYSDDGESELNIVKVKNSKLKKYKKVLEPHELFRHAAQALYSPDFSIEKPGLLRPFAIKKDLRLDSIYRGSSLHIKPFAAFKYNDSYVYALSVKNKRNRTQQLDVENLFGRIDAIGAGFKHRYVGAKHDTETTLFIVSYHQNIIDVVRGNYVQE